MTTEIGTRKAVRPAAVSPNHPSTAHATAAVAVASMIFARSGTLAWRQSLPYMPNGRKIPSFRTTETTV